jgi:CRP-like cAMP-binding protein
VEGKCRIEKKTADNQQGGNVQVLSPSFSIRILKSLPSLCGDCCFYTNKEIDFSSLLFVCLFYFCLKILGYMEPGSLFGEMSFLEGGGATVSVVAHDDKVIL